ncbi:MAG: antitoxin HigA [Methylobacteriaceae bacterium]|nr:antitoxin HigA [Methylobacteriaceae bacterium]
MPMKNPPHPGAGVRDDIEALGLSISEAAHGLGVSGEQLEAVINGWSSITPEMAVRLEKAIGSTADSWLRMQTSYDLAQVRSREAEIKVQRLAPKVA